MLSEAEVWKNCRGYKIMDHFRTIIKNCFITLMGYKMRMNIQRMLVGFYRWQSEAGGRSRITQGWKMTFIWIWQNSLQRNMQPCEKCAHNLCKRLVMLLWKWWAFEVAERRNKYCSQWREREITLASASRLTFGEERKATMAIQSPAFCIGSR